MLSRSFAALVLLGVTLCPSLAQARITVEALAGRPFGVGRITVPLAAVDANAAQTAPRFWLTDAERRIYYPSLVTGKVREFIGGILGGDGDNALPGQVTAYFLFVGDAPLRVTFYTPVANTVDVTPVAPRGRQFERLQGQWWKEYQAAAAARLTVGEVPPLVDAYLTGMLSQRLKLPLASPPAAATDDLPQKTLDLLLGVEKLRAGALRDTMLGRNLPAERADLPVPRDIDWGSFASVKPPAGVTIEPIAMHVPLECFYIRFGKFSNYLWLDHLTEDYGGDLANMATLRGQDLRLSERMQTALCLEKNKTADLFGDAVIADVALIGRDIYTHEGAALGMLFQARNAALLANDFQTTRKAIAKREAARGATLETVTIAGRDVSLLSTPDNYLRSFYAVDGDYHLVTTSEAIVARFFEAGQGKGALGGAAEFHHARELMPTKRDDTIFVYFSTAMFQSLVGPQYQVELNRRLEAVTDMELVLLARHAARGEGKPHETLEELEAGGFLPAGFGRRADGSGPILEGKRIVDSRRGPRGQFTPIPDVKLKGITRREAERWNKLSEFLRTQWTNMDPLMVGIRRFKLNDTGLERITIDANASPFDEKKYGWLTSIVGPSATSRVLPVEGDVIHLQAVVQGGMLDPGVPPHHMFLGVQDHAPLADLKPQGLIKMLRLLKTTPGYLGAWPRPGTLDRLPLGLGGRPDEFGFARMPFGIWRRVVGPWSALGFDPHLLGEASEQFTAEETDNPAQARLHVGDLSSSRAAAWINALYYERARQTSVGNAAFMQHMVQQLHIPPADAQAAVEELIDGKLRCALGGTYECAAYRDGGRLWQSTAWPNDIDRLPPEYRATLLEWFRGADADFTKLDSRVMLRAQLDMQRKATEKKVELPNFNIPNIFADFGKPAAKKNSDKPPPAPRPGSQPREF